MTLQEQAELKRLTDELLEVRDDVERLKKATGADGALSDLKANVKRLMEYVANHDRNALPDVDPIDIPPKPPELLAREAAARAGTDS